MRGATARETKQHLCRQCDTVQPLNMFTLRYYGTGLYCPRQPCRACKAKNAKSPHRDRLGQARDYTTGLLPIQHDCIRRQAICWGCPHGGWLESGPCRIKDTDYVREALEREHHHAR